MNLEINCSIGYVALQDLSLHGRDKTFNRHNVKIAFLKLNIASTVKSFNTSSLAMSLVTFTKYKTNLNHQVIIINYQMWNGYIWKFLQYNHVVPLIEHWH